VSDQRRYCPVCAAGLIRAPRGGRERLVCPQSGCGFVFWDNPAPVVAAIVERGADVVLVRNVGWPAHWYGLVTGFLEAGETPAAAVLREVREETGLSARLGALIGMYPFERMNQVIIAYHVVAEPGPIRIDPVEIADYRLVPVTRVRPWAAGTGLALRDWLRSRGIERAIRPR